MYCVEQRGLARAHDPRRAEAHPNPSGAPSQAQERCRRAEAAAQGKSDPAALTSGSVPGRAAAGCRTPRLVDGRSGDPAVVRLPNARVRKRLGSGKAQQSAAAVRGKSLAERIERQTAVDRSSCSRLTSRRSPVRAGHRPSSGLVGRERSARLQVPLVAQSDSLALGVEGSAPFMGMQHSDFAASDRRPGCSVSC
jgi:hypothetical protein